MNQRHEPAPGVLYLVGTPIGHLGDLSPRAQSVLKDVSVIACEDTRHSGKLLNQIGVTGLLLSFHKHNTKSRLPKILNLLKEGHSVAVISDAGLPGISDPGEHLVAIARKTGHEVICIPGPCAAITALVSSGLPSDRFCFEGFLPRKGKARKQRLAEIANEKRTLVLYESPHRLLQLLEDLSKLCGHERPLQVARELTKRYEEQIGPTIGEALQHFNANNPLGECTIVLGGAPASLPEEKSEEYWVTKLDELLTTGASASEAARKLSEESGQSKRYLYNLLHRKGSKRCE